MTTYTNDTKAQVIADFTMGMSKSGIAKKHGLPRTTVIGILKNHEPPVPTVSDMQKRDELEQLVYDYLKTGLETLIAQHQQAADPQLTRGKPTALAALYDSIHRGVITVAGAVERGAVSDDDIIDPPALPPGPG